MCPLATSIPTKTGCFSMTVLPSGTAPARPILARYELWLWQLFGLYAGDRSVATIAIPRCGAPRNYRPATLRPDPPKIQGTPTGWG